MQKRNRVVITGGGCVSCLGIGEAALQGALRHPRSGIHAIQMDPPVSCRTQAGGQINRAPFQAALRAEGIRFKDLALDAATLAAGQALAQAHLRERPDPPHDIAVIIGSGASNVEQFFEANRTFFAEGARRVRPTTVPRCMNNAISAQLAIRYHLTGPNFVVSSACASSSAAIGQACRMIQHGYWRQALCGGADTIFSPFTLAAWDRLGIMSQNPDPTRACRPFDRDRDGCVIGEGAAALVLESLASAQDRGATIRAEICGYGESSDASHMTTPDARGQAAAVRKALADAGIQPDALGWIHAHGTGTIVNDRVECESLRMALGASVTGIPVVSLKPYYGHMLGGAGVMDMLSTVIALEQRFIPAAMNLEHPDETTHGICMAASTPQPASKPYALKCGYGFGGSNAVFVLRQWDET